MTETCLVVWMRSSVSWEHVFWLQAHLSQLLCNIMLWRQLKPIIDVEYNTWPYSSTASRAFEVTLVFNVHDIMMRSTPHDNTLIPPSLYIGDASSVLNAVYCTCILSIIHQMWMHSCTFCLLRYRCSLEKRLQSRRLRLPTARSTRRDRQRRHREI